VSRSADLDRFYGILADLAARVDGPRRLADCTGHLNWPDRGIYLFFGPDDADGGAGRTGVDRVTRVGTHAVSTGAGTSLWSRLRTHRGATRGTYEGGGNHRGSVFRKRVGEALIEREGLDDEYPTWGEGSSAARERRLAELPLERRVSEYVRDLPFLWVAVDDEPGPDSDRAVLERNAIALLSNRGRDAVDPRPGTWLGGDSRSAAIRESGLWNVDGVDERYDPSFLDRLAAYAAATDPVD
jgi:hypothetical protein